MPQKKSQRVATKQGKTLPPKWTIMIYLAGDNNLTSNCIAVLQELEASKPNKDVKVLACFDSNTPRPKGSRYLEINTERSVDTGLDWEIHNALVPPDDRGHSIIPPNFCEDPGKSKRGLRSGPVAAEGLSRFIKWSLDNYEAERYMLILYGHGGLVAGQTFLIKENPPSFLRLPEFRKVLAKYFGPRRNRKLDILACANCVMNGVETAFEVREQVDLMIGSQGLMLAVGWPFRKIIDVLGENPGETSKEIARKMLKACARNLIDFALMDRSSEQAACDLATLGDKDNVVTAVRRLACELIDGLDLEKTGKRALLYPAVCDAVRLARLEAQTFWGETFVDLYDFCERLMLKCDEVAKVNGAFLKELGLENSCAPQVVRNTKLVQRLKAIIDACGHVQKEVKRMISDSYYIGSDLQYSHGLSVYFPWTLPEAPYFFDPIGRNDYWLRTAFETYGKYQFAEPSQWSAFLNAFFRATLRRVRRAERELVLRSDTGSLDVGLIDQIIEPAATIAIDLQKSSSDTGPEDDCTCSAIKNYPRRNYLSPADCERKIDQADGQRRKADKNPPVSYLGWNIAGLLADVITAKKPKYNHKAKTASKRTR